MPDLNESIAKLTTSLQTLTKQSYGDSVTVARHQPKLTDTNVAESVEAFVSVNREYAESTRSVSVGTY